MVRRLVHYQEVGVAGEKLREGHPLYFASGKLAHLLLRLEVKLVEDLARPKLVFEVVLREDLLGYRVFGLVFELLFEEGYADFLKKANASSRVGFVFARENAHKRGLARAVRRDECYLVAFVYVKGDVFEKDLGSV